MNDFQYSMNQNVSERVSNFNGTIVARCEYTNYNSYCLRGANLSSDGEIVEQWINEDDLL